MKMNDILTITALKMKDNISTATLTQSHNLKAVEASRLKIPSYETSFRWLQRPLQSALESAQGVW